MPQKNSEILQEISKRFIEAIDEILLQPKVYNIHSIKELSEICQFGTNTISKIRNGHMNVTLEHVYHFCKYFNINSNTIIFETQFKERKTIEQRLHTLESILLRDGKR